MFSFAEALAARQGQTGGTDSSVAVHTVWDGVYTEAQANRGRESYQMSCARCHPVDDASGLPERRFIGNRFWAAWGEDSLDKLYGFLRDAMPNDAPGTLSNQTYVDVTAYLLQVNGAPAGATELTGPAAGSIRLARRDSDGSMPTGAFVAVVGCLAKAAAGAWTITAATRPVRSRMANTAADRASAAAQPQGTRVFDLLYVVTPLDKLAGHQVLVRGLLVREPVDAVNVTSVETVAETCQPY